VSSVVLGSETPINEWENGLFFIINCPKDTAAYFSVPSSSKYGSIERWGLSAFSTNLAKNHGIFNIIRVKEKEG